MLPYLLAYHIEGLMRFYLGLRKLCAWWVPHLDWTKRILLHGSYWIDMDMVISSIRMTLLLEMKPGSTTLNLEAKKWTKCGSKRALTSVTGDDYATQMEHSKESTQEAECISSAFTMTMHLPIPPMLWESFWISTASMFFHTHTFPQTWLPVTSGRFKTEKASDWTEYERRSWKVMSIYTFEA